jgi:hypothetical protein
VAAVAVALPAIVPVAVRSAGAAGPLDAGDVRVAAASVPSRFVPVAPRRVLDTRDGTGADRAPVAAGGVVVLALVANGIVPAGATAVVVNVTATEPAGPGYVTAYPAGTAIPGTSALNVERPGQTIADLVTSALSPDGRLALTTSVRTHLVVDLAGYFVPSGPTGAGRLVVGSPTRVVDTRSGLGLAGPLGAGTTALVDLRPAVPADAAAAILTVTVAGAAGPGYWTVAPAGRPAPLASTVNAEVPGQVIANQAIVATTSGRIAVTAQTGGQLVVDVVGWVTGAGAPVTTDGLFVALPPRRVLDTRTGARPLPGVDVPVVVSPDVPAAASAVTATVTLTQADAPGFVVARAAGAPPVAVSALNATRAGQTIAGHVVAAVSDEGLAVTSSGGGHLVVDVTGYVLGRRSASGTVGPSAPVPGAVPPRPVPDGQGDPTAYRFLQRRDGYALPARWDPCAVVRVGVHREPGTPPFAVDELQAALGELGHWTGLDVVLVGEVDRYRPGDGPPPGVDAVVQFEPFSTTTDLAGATGTLGVGGGSTMWGPHRPVRAHRLRSRAHQHRSALRPWLRPVRAAPGALPRARPPRRPRPRARPRPGDGTHDRAARPVGLRRRGRDGPRRARRLAGVHRVERRPGRRGGGNRRQWCGRSRRAAGRRRRSGCGALLRPRRLTGHGQLARGSSVSTVPASK